MSLDKYATLEKKDGVLTIWLDKKDEKVNIISLDFIPIFEEIFDAFLDDDDVSAAVLISRKKDFIAGADIESFKAEKEGDFRPVVEKGHAIFNKLENSPKPVVSAVHGTCYGLGTEISLACAARIASDDPSTKFALPEVKLGLLPAGGGTQRLPRLVGLQKSFDMMLTGKNIYAFPAKKIGLVDELVDKNKLHSAACKLAKSLVDKPMERKRRKKLLDRFLDDTAPGNAIVYKKARQMVNKMARGNYPAVPEIINCVETGLKKGMKKGFRAEAEKFEKLLIGDVSSELINIFFNMTKKGKNPQAGAAKKVDRIAVLGAGLMGEGITEVSVNNGIDVLLKDLSEDMITDAKTAVWKGVDKKIRRKALSKADGETIISRIRGQLDYSDFDKADLVIEAVFEDMDLKKKILAELEEHCREDFIFASNTSALSITNMSENARHPENVIGMHYFSPVPKMPLLEIIRSEHTSDEVIATCYELGIRQGKICIVVKDMPGFYVNRILSPYLNECVLMLEDGVGIRTLDNYMKNKGFPVGPFALLDEVGLDVGAHVLKGDLAEMAKLREGAILSTGITTMYENGLLGRKCRKGFYLYHPKTGKRQKDNPEVYKLVGKSKRKKFDEEEAQNRGVMLMVNEAVTCLQEGIIENPTDGDMGAVFGIGFLPFTGGPFRYIDRLGADKILSIMEGLTDRIGARFKPADMLRDYARTGKKFH